MTAHLNVLQGIITRLANNSASCKTWCLTLTGAVVGLAGAAHVPEIVGFVLAPVAVFGFMDIMYLAQESAYRRLWRKVVATVRDGSYRRDTAYEAGAGITKADVGMAIGSWSIWPVYAGLILAYIIADQMGWIQALAQHK